MSRRSERGGFTLIELLVVIAIISLLAAIMIPVIGMARAKAREAKCRSNLRQVALALEQYQVDYGQGRYYPPWLTLMTLPLRPGAEPMVPPELLICPEDPTEGADGGRPNGWTWGKGGAAWDQYTNTDIDPPEGYGEETVAVSLNGSGADTIPCSYMFEWCGEPCEWVKDYVPDKNEWEWIGSTPSTDEFVRMADTNGDGVLSWFEVKRLTMDGYRGRLSGVGSRLPMVRCFWHMRGPAARESEENVLNITAGYTVYKGLPSWYEDKVQ